MARDSLHNWVQKGAVRGRKVICQRRSIWLLWADEAELERLRELREFPDYGPHSPRIEMDAPMPQEQAAQNHDEKTDSACQNPTHDVS